MAEIREPEAGAQAQSAARGREIRLGPTAACTVCRNPSAWRQRPRSERKKYDLDGAGRISKHGLSRSDAFPRTLVCVFWRSEAFSCGLRKFQAKEVSMSGKTNFRSVVRRCRGRSVQCQLAAQAQNGARCHRGHRLFGAGRRDGRRAGLRQEGRRSHHHHRGDATTRGITPSRPTGSNPATTTSRFAPPATFPMTGRLPMWHRQDRKRRSEAGQDDNIAPQLTSAEWLASMPGTDDQKAFLQDCIDLPHADPAAVERLHGG